MVCMAGFQSSNGHASSHIDNICIKLSTHVYFMVLSHSMWSRIKILKTDFHEVITNGLHSCIFETHFN